jgi:isoamylase
MSEKLAREQLLSELKRLQQELHHLEAKADRDNLLQTVIQYIENYEVVLRKNTETTLLELDELKKDKSELELLLQIVTEHGDHFEAMLDEKIQVMLKEKQQLEIFLEQLLAEIESIGIFPTHNYNGFQVRLSSTNGQPFPFGATVVPGGINFSIYSQHATSCVLVLFEKGQIEPMVEIPFCGLFEQIETKTPVSCEFRIGHVFTMTVFNLDYNQIEYGFRMEGPGEVVPPGLPSRHRFDANKILLDPYAKAIGGRDIWGKALLHNEPYPHRARIMRDNFNWQFDRPLELPMEDLMIYEMHVRGFTQHPSSQVDAPGTYAAIKQKIPYFKELGINCLELLPIHEFDELENKRVNPETGEKLMNYWGYNTIGFFAPKAGYAEAGKTQDGTLVANEFKELVKALHQNGIEVILDVVFNHTAESDEDGPIISFKGIDNSTYYLLTPEEKYHNFSGTGNTLNCNHPIVRNIILEALRYWVTEYHIDGFRFDLASILVRDKSGTPLSNPPLIETLSYDPILAKCKLIAEAWDASGLYQVGTFPDYGRWAEWNGIYRDDLRHFLRGDNGIVPAIMERIQGSPDLYAGRGTIASINFITCHDGFTLLDLFSYQEKHNQGNGENNRDGTNDNLSLNYDCEGETDDPKINALRKQQLKNAIAILMVSQGVPMILMGDEVARTQKGNNNTYCQDNEQNWFDWTLLNTHQEVFRFVKNCMAFRKAHPLLRNREHFCQQESSGHSKITWHGIQVGQPDLSYHSHTLAFMLAERDDTDADDFIYVAMNMYWENLDFQLPGLPEGMKWYQFANTSRPSPEDNSSPGSEPLLSEQQQVLVAAHSVVILVGR